jgi:cell division cycle 14
MTISMLPDGYEITEFIKNKLYFVVVDTGATLPYSDNTNLYFTTDESFVYVPLKEDNGPLNLGMIYKYCKLLKEKLQDPANNHKKFYHCTNGDESKRTNAAFLISAFLVIILGKLPEEAYAPLKTLKHTFSTFHDCWKSPNVQGITILDCLYGLHKATSHNFFNYETFDVHEYDHRQEVNNGDMNWIIPGKILAFKGPRTSPKNQPTFPPDYYLPHLQQLGIKVIVRLNKNHYDKTVFTKNGMKHYDLYFGDGTIPKIVIVEEFLKLVETETGAIAVHCKGGIGRTGTLIACCLIQFYNFTAQEAISWIRICRSGSIMGQQHIFLETFVDQKLRN